MIGPSKTLEAVSPSQHKAPRKVNVRQWPCGKAPHPLALQSPSAQWGDAHLDPGLVDEDQTAGIEPGLPRYMPD